MLQFAANLTMLFNEVPFMARFEAAAQTGFRGVEFLFPYAWAQTEVAAELHRNRLENVLFNLPPGNWEAGERGLACHPDRQIEFRESVAEALDWARTLGTRRLHVMAGLQPVAISRQDCRAVFIENLRHAARALAAHDITLLIEPINTFDMPGYFLTTQAEAHALRAEVSAPNLKVQMDLYHVQRMEGDLATKIRRYLPDVGHIQIAGAPDRHEPDQGEVNYPYLFRLLDALGYNGWIGCEYRPAGETLAGLGWWHAAQNLN